MDEENNVNFATAEELEELMMDSKMVIDDEC